MPSSANYYAFLGHQPQLSLLELETLLDEKLTPVVSGIVATVSPKLLVVADKLGGTTKIAQSVATVASDEVIDNLFRLIKQDPASAQGRSTSGGKNVAITNYLSTRITQKDIHDLKERLVAVRPIRFVSFDDHDHELLMLSKKHVAEFNLIPQDGQVVIAQTIWIFDSLGFAARDRKKPYQDIKRGMLPVKIARIMVNLAVSGEMGKLILDPFCGTGTVLSEALMVGCKIAGSDLDHLAMSGTETNLSWLSSRYNTKDMIYKLFVSDATAVDSHLSLVDAIVTEPLMGPLLDARRQLPEIKIKNIARGLDKLYRGALRSWHKILPSRGRVVMTLPIFNFGTHTVETISVDTITALGYNVIASVPYSKPGVTVVRNITILEKLAN